MTKVDYRKYKDSLKRKIERRLKREIGETWFVTDMTNLSVDIAPAKTNEPKVSKREYIRGCAVKIGLDIRNGEPFYYSYINEPINREVNLVDTDCRAERILYYDGLSKLLSSASLLSFILELIKENNANYKY